MPVLNAQDLRKAYGSRQILDGVTLTIRTGERVGLVGINGSGKSTLSRILAGEELPDSGAIAKRRGARVAYLPQNPRLPEDKTAREVVLAGLDAWADAKARYEAASNRISALSDSRASIGGDGDADEAARTEALAAQADALADLERHGGWDVPREAEKTLLSLGLTRLDAPIAELSGGERRRVDLARLLLARPDLAILDEPSNHLDVETIEWLEAFLLESFKGAVLLVTHDRYLLDRVAERTLEVEHGAVHSYPGGYEAYLTAKAERLLLESRTEQNRQNFLRTELEWLRRQPKARGTKQKARIERAETAIGDKPKAHQKTAQIALEASRSGQIVLDLKEVELSFPGRRLVDKLNLIVQPGERLGIAGRSGSGKTTLLRAILGELRPTRGSVTLGASVKIAYFDQHRTGLDETESIFENVAEGRARIPLGAGDIDARGYLERFLFDGHSQRRPVAGLSGGERARVLLAKLLSHPSNLLVLDEPTNDLDVQTLGALEEMLTEARATALVVTHDRYFLDRIATSMLTLEGDGRVTRTAGGYTDSLAQRPRSGAGASAGPSAPPTSGPSAPVISGPSATGAVASGAGASGGARGQVASQPAAPKPKALSFAEKKELEGLLDRVDAAETEAARLEALLSDPATYAARGAEVAALTATLEKAKAEVQRLTARWEELEARAKG